VAPVAEALSRIAVLERARETVADRVSALLVGAPSEQIDTDFPIEPDTMTDVGRDRIDDCIKLLSGKTSGNFIVKYDPPHEDFLAWQRIVWQSFNEEGSISVSLLDALGVTIYSGLSSPLMIGPYPGDLDMAERLPGDWGGIATSSLTNSEDAVFGRYSMKAVFTGVGIVRGLYYPIDKNMGVDLSDYRVMRARFETDAESPIEVRLHTDDSNYFKKQTVAVGIEWSTPFAFPLDITEWTAVGSPDWHNIAYVSFVIPASNTSVLAFFVDGVRFEKLGNEQISLKFQLSRPGAGNVSPRVKEIVWALLVGGK
jgi:hypothetical protein